MEEFINKLYNYEYFGTYLMISIAVLVLIFIIILVFGKKDQKSREIEETKKLQQINEKTLDGFKETGEGIPLNVEPNLSTPASEPELSPVPNLENDTIIVPTLDINGSLNNESPLVSEPSITPNPEPMPLNEAINSVSEPLPYNDGYTANYNQTPVIDTVPNVIPNIENKPEDVNKAPVMPEVSPIPEVTPSIPETPVLMKEEEKPFSFAKPDVMPEETFPGPELSSVPEFNFDKLVQSTTVKPSSSREVFSSVYPHKEEEDIKIEMPIKKENEDEDIELPTLKKDTEEEKPILNDYNLHDLTGEAYNINNLK